MAKMVFERREKKYLLDRYQYLGLMSEAVKHLVMDEYGHSEISNLYLDNDDYEMIRTSIEKPVYKEKVRLRAYGPVTEDSEVFLELKKKYAGVVYKRRMSMSWQQARRYLYEGIRPAADSQVLREIDHTIRRCGLKPKVYLAYRRDAFRGKDDPELRVTFDRDIRCRHRRPDLTVTAGCLEMLEPDQTLMELKANGAMPLWMSRLLSDLEIFPVSYSKYGAYYKEFICGEPELERHLAQEVATLPERSYLYA